ncbi:MAG: FHA domain-containing protein [Bacteroidales bacterium]|jgi:pSer/pThr/pTyr-binding forkhead associated (FHA) protein|nr:FHA domain-containing protein [Bacteroidales bacterium]
MKKITIGLDQSCTIKIIDPSRRVSRNHATLYIDGNRMILEDHSSNGTTVNGRKLCNSSTEINQGDEILLGNTVRLSWSEINSCITQKKTNPASSRNTSGIRVFIIILVVILVIGGIIYMVVDNNRMCEETYTEYENISVPITWKEKGAGYHREEGNPIPSLAPYPKLTFHCYVTNTSENGATFTLNADVVSSDEEISFSVSKYIAPGITDLLSQTKDIRHYTFKNNVSWDYEIEVSPKTQTISSPVTKTRMVKCKDLR